MGIIILYRNSLSQNLFNNILINSIPLFGNSDNLAKILLCSGFFQENKLSSCGPSSYMATCEPGLLHNIATHTSEAIFVGIHNYNWKNSYVNFAQNMKNFMAHHNQQEGRQPNLHFFIRKPFNWHAKVFIINSEDKYLAIIGSSNITSAAFGSQNNRTFTSNKYNIECDVLMWSDEEAIDSGVLSIIRDTRIESSDPSLFITNGYSPESNGGFTMEDKIIRLRNDILGENYPETLSSNLIPLSLE